MLLKHRINQVDIGVKFLRSLTVGVCAVQLARSFAFFCKRRDGQYGV